MHLCHKKSWVAPYFIASLYSPSWMRIILSCRIKFVNNKNMSCYDSRFCTCKPCHITHLRASTFGKVTFVTLKPGVRFVNPRFLLTSWPPPGEKTHFTSRCLAQILKQVLSTLCILVTTMLTIMFPNRLKGCNNKKHISHLKP